MSTISERVQRGAAWLDEQMPNWWTTHGIDLSRLDLSRPCHCVVGQLAPEGDFADAINGGWFDLTFEAAWRFGMTAVPPVPGFMDRRKADEIYRQLDAEWRRVITERRAAA